MLFSKLATVGNAVDVTPGELVEYFLEDPDTEVIGLYLKGRETGLACCPPCAGLVGASR